MHRECFEVWQENILAYIGKLEGGKRSKHWSDKQRVSVVAAAFSLDILLQIDALWKPSGYHMAVESCLCRCSEVSGRWMVELVMTVDGPMVVDRCGVAGPMVVDAEGQSNGRDDRGPSCPGSPEERFQLGAPQQAELRPGGRRQRRGKAQEEATEEGG